MRVVTWNLRTDTAAEPPHWPDRLPEVARVLTDLAPHVIGTQEGSARMLDDLAASLPDRYAWVGEGRRGGHDDEFTAVFYDTSRLELLTSRTTWLSEQPDVAGTLSWGSAFPRTATTLRLRDRADDAAYTVVDTHLDHVSARARAEGARLIAASLPHGPAIVLGDFNAPADPSDPEGPYAVLTAAGLGDAVALHLRGGVSVGTFTDFADPVVGAERIDWVLVSRDLEVIAARVVTDVAAGGVHPSDHLPVVADVAPLRARRREKRRDQR
ncbi:endonuclease/exonuclease/phosphatase family protein [Humibacillus xanthopallidus]|uniref:endonuclease/exonuclease/phosphatase family protein n=1 Tax=Humibacillus xanthopallidus TaxID=412689 RepID=UPI00384D34C6